MGVNNGSAAFFRIKRRGKIRAKSLDLKRYNNFLLRKRDCLEPSSDQREMTDMEAAAGSGLHAITLPGFAGLAGTLRWNETSVRPCDCYDGVVIHPRRAVAGVDIQSQERSGDIG